MLSPLWVALIASVGFAGAAGVVGAVTVAAIWWLSGRYLGRTPTEMGTGPDGDAPGLVPAAMPVGGSPWRNGRFVTLAAATSLELLAQIGLIAHLFSVLVPALGTQMARFAAGLATACAIVGRTGLGWLLPPGANRRRAAAASYGVQVCGSLVLLAAGGTDVALLVLGVMLFGLDLGNATSVPPLIVQQDFAPAGAARAVALVMGCSQACYAFAPAVFGALRDVGLRPGPLFIAAGCVQMGAACVVLVRPTPPQAARAAVAPSVRPTPGPRDPASR